MRKVVIILAGVSVLLSLGLIFLVIQSKAEGVPLFSIREPKYIIKGKMWQEPADIREWITPYEYAIQLEAQKLKGSTPKETVLNTFNWLESGYHYEQDNLVVYNANHEVLQGGVDSWNLPIVTLAMKHQNQGQIWVDCEDGVFLLVSLLRANGIDAWACKGTITIDSGIYGHMWAVVNLDKEYLLETTIGQPIQELQTVPDFYHLSVKFNEKDVYTITESELNEVFPPLTIRQIERLKELLAIK